MIITIKFLDNTSDYKLDENQIILNALSIIFGNKLNVKYVISYLNQEKISPYLSFKEANIKNGDIIEVIIND